MFVQGPPDTGRAGPAGETAMPRPDKVAVVDDVRQRLDDATAAVLTEYRGLSVDDLAELRARLRDSDASYRVVKNTLTRLAARDAGLEIPDDLLIGPTAITFCAGDPVAAAKVLRAFSREHPSLIIKGGVLEGRVLDAAETSGLADLASREELLARLAGMMQAIIAQPARLAQANLVKFARLLAALKEKHAAGPQAAAAHAETADTHAGHPEAAEPDTTAAQVEAEPQASEREASDTQTGEADAVASDDAET